MSCRRWRYMPKTLGTKASIAAEVVPRSAYELQALAIHARNRALVAAEVVPRSAYELQALAIHAKDQALIAAEVVPRSAYERQAWRYMPKTRL